MTKIAAYVGISENEVQWNKKQLVKKLRSKLHRESRSTDYWT